jgi:hypothetical protein
MITRFLLILAGLFAVGIVGAFLLYVSVLSLLAAISVMIGLLATLVLGYWAGCNSLEEPPKSAKHLRNVSVLDASGDVNFFPEIPTPNTTVQQSW